MAEHVIEQLAAHRERHGTSPRPLLVGLQGPQGSGKTFLSGKLRDALSAAPRNLAVAVLSVDDLYLPHADLVALARAHPDNALLRGRGQPGTHDVTLGTKILHELRDINLPGAKPVVLPIFDKSLHGGEGDRLAEGAIVHPPLDVVILEGWFIGFCPITDEEILKRYNLPVTGLAENFLASRSYRIEHIRDINERLRPYVAWWSLLDIFIQISPLPSTPYTHIYKWRLQQEHAMKSRNGGKGMSDEQIEAFVDRYIPGYVFFSDGVTNGMLLPDGSRQPPPWKGRGLRITIGETRELVNVEKF
ncbi:P-loop containing nucleoside triphosphate hydrolase protein [Punctularia strigosozonata HHB-11173 SS5]|uniref:P-loop containing nucleoside triphosphate hydrolase protein n=1 Tax=Punctularia strigosozonata (strain HHB-11173) TaxID=741275 RepID=UPI0004417474|nr:P-loop containing nucleoside triphosphate hydrolase protein [Punctularia strigosozonata HHB-11173 SS5]EIN06685.1 P-loop containing nucleoside triphosphate hydrolase protein [Punctularia strigosozonata HHB-11173 SS5]